MNRAKRCSRCGNTPAERIWDVRPCAIGENITYQLCDDCDLKLNGYVLRFFQAPERHALLRQYARDSGGLPKGENAEGG
jgi:hypothetical protein